MAEDRSFRLPTGAQAVLVFVAAFVAILVFRGRRPDLDTILRNYDVQALVQRVDDRLDDLRLDPSPALRLRGRQIEWRDGEGRPFLRAPTISFSVRLGGDGVVISDARVESPEVRLVETAPGEWNYERPLAPFLTEDPRGTDGEDAGVSVRMSGGILRDGHVILEMLDGTYEARSLDARLTSARLSGPALDGPVFRVAEAAATLVLPDSGEIVTRPVTLADATLQILDGALDFQVPQATFGGSTFADAEGVWNPALGGLGLDATLTATRARVTDLPWLRAEVPEDATGRFRLRLEPRAGERTALTLSQLEVQAPGSSATGSLTAVIGGPSPVLESVDIRVDPLSLELVEAFTGPFPYRGEVSGTIQGSGGDISFDLQGRLATSEGAEAFVSDFGGRILMTEDGFEIQTASARLDRVPLAALESLVPGLPLQGAVSGSIELSGSPDEAPLSIDVRLEAGGGVVSARGTVDLSGAVPAYDLAGRLVGVDLRRIARPSVPPVEVHAEFEVEGRGTDPATADASIAARGTFTGWQTEPGDTLVLVADIEDGQLGVDELRMDAGPVHLESSGRWQFSDGSGGAIRYDLAVESLTPLGPYLPSLSETDTPALSRGSIEAAGTVSGTLEAPVLEGELTAGDFRHGDWAAATFNASYELDLAREGLPVIRAELSGEEIRTAVGDFETASLGLELARPIFDLAFRADQHGGGGIVSVEAEGRIEEQGGRDIQIRTAEVDLEQQRWRLPAPARVVWTRGEAVRLEGVVLEQVGGDGRLEVRGVVAPMDDLDLELDIALLPVGDVLRLLGSDIDLSGDLSLEGSVSGPAEAPVLDARVTLVDGEVRGVAVRSIESTLRYEAGTLEIDGQGAIGDSARVEVAGTVPAAIRLGGEPPFELLDGEPIELRLVTRTFPLSTLDPGIASLEDVTGRLEADLEVGGTPGAPQLSGSARVARGAFTVPMLERRFTDVTGSVELSGREARIREITLRSGGSARVSGAITFQELSNPAFDVTAELNGLRVQGIEDETGAGMWGTLELVGSLDQPVVTGAVRAADGAISIVPFQQPDLSAQLGGTGSLNLPAMGPDFDLADGDVAPGVVIRDLRVTAGSDLWFVTDEARARLSGDLILASAGQNVTIQGTLEGDVGTFQLRAGGGVITRQFQIRAAEIRFFGSPEPNPRVDITATRVVRLRDRGDVEVEVHVTGTFRNPTLNLGTTAGGTFPESELLSFLLFGRPTSELSRIDRGGGAFGLLYQGLAYTGFGELFGSEVVAQETSVIDYFRIEPTLTGTGLVATAGSDLGSGLFASVDFPLTNGASSAVGLRLDWRFSRQWSMEFAWEPVDPWRGRVGQVFNNNDPPKQWFIASRWRWTY
jgi:hypothetical protein